MNLSKQQKYIGVITFVLAAAAALWGLSAADQREMPAADSDGAVVTEQISWNEEVIEDAAGDVLVARDDVPTSLQVSEDAEFGAAGPFGSAVLAPDTERIAFTTSGAAHDAGWLYEIETDAITPVAFQYGGRVAVAEWSPDARFVAFTVSTPAGTEHILVVDTESVDGYVSEIGQQIKAEEEAGMNPPFSYEFAGWEPPHTLCYSFEDQPQECVNAAELGSGSEGDTPE